MKFKFCERISVELAKNSELERLLQEKELESLDYCQRIQELASTHQGCGQILLEKENIQETLVSLQSELKMQIERSTELEQRLEFEARRHIKDTQETFTQIEPNPSEDKIAFENREAQVL